ncbi:hypothetical protein Tmar_0027 [Thermaerobacter marianensis DSM 12885]|uniref:Uncharacterized protein n=1 Tax=Thermaerobacter marianensis (strain ATCC 700841 / DSM 12885 / JCM 10246 / 7p75a) TaxID=644966 RepID=E6SKG5_THEM7|nr:hypothetical protein [Thermaerobacter marianensis]ADU50152.1 hypothetical protein Tmar_0027 [Thermaerobacter marianensis DSM 12885]
MADPKWTPGPWELCRLSDRALAVKKAGETWGNCGIAIVLSDNREADGHLITAAPDMYEACEAALLAIETNPIDRFLTPEEVDAVEKLQAALRKARGEQEEGDA